MSESPLQELEGHFRRISLIDDVLGVLDWDQATTMPDGSAAARGEQMAALQGVRHQLMTDPRMADLLAAAEESADPVDIWSGANLREMRRRHTHATALPTALVEAQAKANSACEMKWRAARRDNDYAALLPSLEEGLRLTRETAAAKAAALGLAPYDALLDQFEPGGRAVQLDRIFADLAAFLPDFLADVMAKQRCEPAEGVAAIHGEAFGLSPNFRISYATSLDVLTEACTRIQRACAALQGEAIAAE